MKNLIFATLILCLSSCWLTPERLDINDSRLQPLFAAMNEVNRDSLGFTKIDSMADIQIEEQTLIDKPYDIMLHIYGRTSRTIAFEKTATGYRWLGEQEIHKGPRDYETPDGTFKESITITYNKKSISGHKLNTVTIGYLGPESAIYGQDKLTLKEAQNIIKKWNETPYNNSYE